MQNCVVQSHLKKSAETQIHIRIVKITGLSFLGLWESHDHWDPRRSIAPGNTSSIIKSNLSIFLVLQGYNKLLCIFKPFVESCTCFIPPYNWWNKIMNSQQTRLLWFNSNPNRGTGWIRRIIPYMAQAQSDGICPTQHNHQHDARVTHCTFHNQEIAKEAQANN